MVEIQYPDSWDNVSDGRIIVTRSTINVTKEFQLMPGRYQTVEDIIEEFRRILTNHGMDKSIGLYREPVSNKVYLMLRENGTRITLSRNLCNIFGFDQTSFSEGTHRGDKHCDITEGFTSLYVYTNVVEPQIVGDTLAPLLRVVPIPTNHGVGNCAVNFQHIQYLPVVSTGSDIIEILIRRDDGQPVSFQSGKVIVTLHFKCSQ